MPRAILFDLDDTLISAYSDPRRAWGEVIVEFADEIANIMQDGQTCGDVAQSIAEYSVEFWSDAERHKTWRLKMNEARYKVVHGGLERLIPASGEIDHDFVRRLAERFSAYRTQNMFLFDGAHELLDTLKARGVMLGLITNGAAETQRPKIKRFNLTHRFEHIQIEGEMGFGKPEDRAYFHAARALNTTIEDCWIVGDNLEWEVKAPAKLGFKTIWHDFADAGLPVGTDAKPHHTITALPQILEIIDNQ